jgi:hypothetical protein
MARRPAHAQCAPRAIPRRGPGPGKLRPTWAVTRSVKHEPSICIQRPRVDSGRTKRRRCPRVNPRVHSHFLAPRRAPQLAPRRHRHGSSHRCGRSSMGGRAAVERLLGRALPRTAASERPRSLIDERHGGGWCRCSPSHRCARPPMGGRTAIERLLGIALPAQPWRVLSPLPRAVARDLPTRLTDPWPTVVCEGRHVSA